MMTALRHRRDCNGMPKFTFEVVVNASDQTQKSEDAVLGRHP
jgi:hypothetical protein